MAVLAAEPTSYSLDFFAGKALFEKNWIPAPASTTASDGLGPFYNARSCNQCHPDGGRGSSENSLVLHIDDPVYGQQLQKFSVHGLPREAEFLYIESNKKNKLALRNKQISISRLAFGPLQNNSVSARIAPSLRGLALLERIPETALIALADEVDSNGDGISGRVNLITNIKGENAIGRFGWKASQATLKIQVSRALSLDLGLGNPDFPSAVGDCTRFQKACFDVPDGNSPHHDNLEANALVVDLLLTYLSELPAPSRVNTIEKAAENGADLFWVSGCAACHVPEVEIEKGVLFPYSDLLLHDMGPGLADQLGEGSAKGAEWRTPPLWSLGKIKSEFLHDGRAKTLHEAILWHDGEAATARDNYLSLENYELSDLIAFLNSL